MEKVNSIISLISGLIIGIAMYQSLGSFNRRKKLLELFPAVCIVVFLSITTIKYQEMVVLIGTAISFFTITGFNRYGK